MRPTLLALLLLLATACGAAPEPSTQPARTPAGAVLIAALGDSITQGSPLWEPGSREGDEQSQFEYWAQRRLGRGVAFRNCGVFGERTEEIAERLDGCAEGARVLIVQGGINDIAQGRPVEQAADDLRAMVRRGKAKRLRVYLTDVLPWNNGFPDAALPIDALNERIEEIGREERVEVLPFSAALEDPDRPGRMRADLTRRRRPPVRARLPGARRAHPRSLMAGKGEVLTGHGVDRADWDTIAGAILTHTDERDSSAATRQGGARRARYPGWVRQRGQPEGETFN